MSEASQRLDSARERLQAQAAQGAPRYLTVQEVAELARCEHKAVRNAVHSGELEAFRRAERILVREADAIAWIEARPARSATPRPRPSKRRRQAPGSVAALREMESELSR